MLMNYFKKDKIQGLWEDAIKPTYSYFYRFKPEPTPYDLWSMVGAKTENNGNFYEFFKESDTELAEKGKKLVIPIAIGRNNEKKVVILDLAAEKHVLFCGSTGGGKTNGLHCLIFSILKFSHPSFLDLTLIDTKGVSFEKYRPIAKIACSNEEIHAQLDRSITSMEKTYGFLKNRGFEDIISYNKHALKNKQKQFKLRRHRVVVFDEFADFSYQDKEGMAKIIKLAQKGRAAGIHLILATQRPDADVINGLIKANFDSRVCYKVINELNSRIALEFAGAEKIVNIGEAIYRGKLGIIQIQTPKICPISLKNAVRFLASKRAFFKY